MSTRPRAPDDLPAGNGDTGPAAAMHAPQGGRVHRRVPQPPGDARPGPRPANLAAYWAIILRRFRDHVHRSTPDGGGHHASQADPPGQ
jgi:hypothetical protein